MAAYNSSPGKKVAIKKPIKAAAKKPATKPVKKVVKKAGSKPAQKGQDSTFKPGTAKKVPAGAMTPPWVKGRSAAVKKGK